MQRKGAPCLHNQRSNPYEITGKFINPNKKGSKYTGTLQQTITLGSEFEESYNIEDVSRKHKEEEKIEDVDARHKHSLLLEEYSKKKQMEKQNAAEDYSY